MTNPSKTIKFIFFLVSITILGLHFDAAQAHDIRAAFTKECPSTKFPEADGATESPMLTSIAVSVASSLVDTGIATLKKAVNPESKSVEGRFLEQGLYMYRNYKGNPEAPLQLSVKAAHKLGCLVIAVGEFSSEGFVYDAILPFKNERASNDANTRIGSALGLEGTFKLAYYLEAARVFSGDQTAVTWKPVRIYVGEYLNESFFAGGSRSAVIEMNLYKPGKKEAFFTQNFQFSEIKKPMSKGPGELKRGYFGSWGLLPAAPAVTKGFEATDDGHLFDPFTLEVRLVEAPKPYALAQTLIDAVDKNKEAIKKEVVNSIDSNAKATTEMTANTATIESITAYLTAFKLVVSDCATAKLTDNVSKLNCSIYMDKALITKEKAELACASNPVASCNSLPSLPLPQ